MRHVVQFASDDDPFISLELQRSVRDALEAAGGDDDGAAAAAGSFEYVELRDRSHFFGSKQPEILAAVERVAAAAGAAADDT